MIKPKQLNPGDKVAIVSLSSGILGEDFCKHQLERGIQRLKDMGLKPVIMPNALKGMEYIHNNPQARAQDLKDAFKDNSIKGIICTIGGEDTLRLAPYLMEDEEFIHNVQTKPKLFTGFSDTTNNHLMFYKLGMLSYYGPNFLSDLAELEDEMLEYTQESFLNYFKNEKSVEIKSSPIWYDERTDFSIEQIGVKRIAHKEKRGFEFFRGEGVIKGRLLGGCLESLSDMLDPVFLSETKEINEKYKIFPSLDEWKNKILFLETSEEFNDLELMRKMIHNLDTSGIFAQAKALIVGKPQDERFYEELKQMLLETTENYALPIVYNLNFGHSAPRCVIPYGLEMLIDFETKKLEIIEPFFA